MVFAFLPMLLMTLALAAPEGRQDGDEVESATIRGHVLDPWGEPVAGAQVEMRYHVGGPPWNWGSIGVRTDAEGRFESTVLPPGATTVIARGRDWASSAPLSFELQPDQVLDGLELVLGIGGRLTGEVFGPDGRPDAGCSIQVQSTLASERFGRQVVSDPQGFFVLECLDPGTYHLAVLPTESAPGGGGDVPPVERLRMATVEVVAYETVHVVLGGRARAPVRLHGEVRLAGREGRDLMVAALGPDAPGLGSLKASNVDSSGLYELTLDGPGDHVIVVGDPHTGEPYAEFLRRVPAAREHRLDLEASRGGVRGRVTGADGRGVEGVPLAIHSDTRPSVFDAVGGRRTRSGPGGIFAFDLLPPGDYTLRAGVAFEGAWNPTGHAVAVSQRLRLGVGEVVSGVELVLARPGTLAGVVVDAAGNPVVGATVFLRDEAGRLLDPLSAHRSGPEGRFAVEHVAPGAVTASARTARECAPESAPVTLRAGETAEVRLVLGAGTILRVRTADTSGSPHASVSILDELGREVGAMRDLERVKTHPAAEILGKERSFGPLAPGTYRVIAIDRAGQRFEQRVRLDGSPARSLVLRR